MVKRFTDSDKWKDKWFRRLPAEQKLAYLYVLDQCDQAGVLDLDEELADFQIGASIDWDGFLAACDGRVVRIAGGKLWVTKFVEFQYGELSANCKAHSPAFASIKKHGLERVSKPFPKGIQRDQVKDKVKEKEKVRDKAKDIPTPGHPQAEWSIPDRLDNPRVRELLEEFAAMRKGIGKRIRDFGRASRVLDQFDDAAHLTHALETCIANDYQGLRPDYRPAKPAVGVPTTKKELI